MLKVEPDDSLGEPPKKKKRQKKTLLDRMQGQVTDLTVPTENLRKEVNEYVGAMVKAGMSPLQWWAIHSVSYQNVADLARYYLAIPPTEVINNYSQFLNSKT